MDALLQTARPRPWTSASVSTASRAGGKEDAAIRRLLRTPRVFQSRGDASSEQRGRELRANLLPSILRAPSEMPDKTPKVEPPEDGKFHQAYNKTLEDRQRVEDERSVFLERDPALNLAALDPQQLAAEACTPVFKDLVIDRLTKFRRPREGLVNTASELPFGRAEQSFDLAKLSDLFTIDVERYEYPFKGTAKRPGFTSLQLASRVPLVVRDPIGEERMKSEPLANDVHVMRLDLQPGEIRQVAYTLDSSEFRATKLAGRLAAILAPEDAVLAKLMGTLRAKESEVRALTSVFDDLLRSVTAELPAHPPERDTEACNEAHTAARLEALAAEPRRTLARLVGAFEALACLVAPLMPSFAHAFDRATLIVVREVDRIVARFHADYEELFARWAVAEAERRRLAESIRRMGGCTDGAGGAELLKNRVSALEAELAQQERAYSFLLQEKNQHQAAADQSERLGAALRLKNDELQRNVARLQQERRDRINVDTSVGEGPRAASPEIRAAAATRQGRDVMPFALNRSVQTETEHFFCDSFKVAESLPYEKHHEIMRTAARLYRHLCRYEWSPVASAYLNKSQDEDLDIQLSEAVASKLLAGRGKKKPNLEATADNMAALHQLGVKVDHAVQNAKVVQMENVISRLHDGLRKQFDTWVHQVYDEAKINCDVRAMKVEPRSPGSSPRSSMERPGDHPSPPEVWQGIIDLVDMEGCRSRIAELEGNLKNLLPLAERSTLHAYADSDGGFWNRVMGIVRQNAMTRKQLKPKDSVIKGMDNAEVQKALLIWPLPQILEELHAIWASFQPRTDEDGGFHRGLQLKSSGGQSMKAGVKAFYLRKSGRSKQVEISTISLFNSVLELCAESHKVALFALVCDVQPASLLRDRSPHPFRTVDFHFSFDLLGELPADAPQALGTLAVLLSQIQEVGGNDGDRDLPLQAILRAGLAPICNRSRLTTQYFQLLLFAFTEFLPPEPATALPEREGSASRGSFDDDKASEMELELPNGGGRAPAAMLPERAEHETIFVSHLIAAHVSSDMESYDDDLPDMEEFALDSLWNTVMSDSTALGAIRQTLGLASGDASCKADKVGELLSRRRVANLSDALVSRVFVAAVGPGAVEVERSTFKAVAAYSRKPNASRAVCREGAVLWAALWALACERLHEFELMGVMFDLYDTSGDGHLQFDEFEEYLTAVAPELGRIDAEDIFLIAAESVADGMTKATFLSLVQRFGIASSPDILEQMVATKRATMYGSEQAPRYSAVAR